MLRPGLLLALLLCVGGQHGHAAVFPAGAPVEGPAGRNGVHDVSPASCDLDLGCFTNTGARCRAEPDERCDVQVTPAGRCSKGVGSCVWPQGAGVCRAASGETVDPVACLSDAYLDFLANGGANPGNASGPSLMCADVEGGDGHCDMQQNDPSCDCSGTDPLADLPNADPDVPSWEGVVCGDDPQATCSDGDPDRASVGYGSAVCRSHCGIGGCIVDPECGSAHTFDNVITGVKFDHGENPPEVISPQRRPGTGYATPDLGGPLIAPVRTAPWSVDDAGEGDFQAAGVRRLRRFSNGALADAVFSTTLGIPPGQGLTSLHACEIPDGWRSELPISGRCQDQPARFCIEDDDCSSGICDPGSFVYCHEADGDPHTPEPLAFDSTGFLFTRSLEPGEQSGSCPPDCRRTYDLDTFELEAVEGLGFDSADPRAGLQLFLDNLEGPRADAGDALAYVRFVRAFSISGDSRCYIGGDPFRPNPSDGKIGRCLTSDLPCDPRLARGSNGCPGNDHCRFCGGTSSVPPDPSNIGFADFGGHYGHDPVRGNPQALPVGYDSHGLDVLDPSGRIGRLNGDRAQFVHPIVLLLAPGPARTVFKDNDNCGSGGCDLGQTSGGSPGLGPTFTYIDAGDPVPHEPSAAAPAYLASLTVPPGDPGVEVGFPPLVTVDAGVGPDGVPGCLGDNHKDEEDPPCDERLGDPSEPGSTGLDDPRLEYDFSEAQDGSALREATALRGSLVGDGLALTPAWSGSSAWSARDVLPFPGFFQESDEIRKDELTFCPIVSREGNTLNFGFACSGSDLDGDGVLDEQDGCPLNPAFAHGTDSGSVSTPADLQGSIKDGIIDECQCGDVTDDGIVNGNDATLITFACIDFDGFFPNRCAESQASPTFVWEKCDVGAGANCQASPGNCCNGNDSTLITFVTLGLAPGLDNVCPAYMP